MSNRTLGILNIIAGIIDILLVISNLYMGERGYAVLYMVLSFLAITVGFTALNSPEEEIDNE